jgi:hypothetical protein
MSTSDDDYIPVDAPEYDSDTILRKVNDAKRQKKKRKQNSNLAMTVTKRPNTEQNPLVKLSDDDMLRIYDEVSNAFKSMEQHVCAVCDNLIVALACTHTDLSSLSQTLLNRMRKRLVFPNDLPELLRLHYDVSSFSAKLDGIMMSKRGIWLDDMGEVKFIFCDRCFSQSQ